MSKELSIPLEADLSIVYGFIKNMKYEQYLAIAEFVDNSVQSFIDNKELLKKVSNQDAVQVIIETTDDFISIRDNAGGFSSDVFDYAFRLAKPEALKSAESLNEFGVGMKTAAIWFGDKFVVETSPIGENLKYTIDFDIDRIGEEKLTSLSAESVKVSPETKERHYTNITISRLNRKIQGSKIHEFRNHLKDVYRKFLASGELILKSKGKNSDLSIKYEPEKVLEEHFWLNQSGPFLPEGVEKPKEVPKFKWKKNISFEMPKPMEKVEGQAFLSQGTKKLDSGIMLFRRGRGILGTGKDTRYRPRETHTGQSNEVLYQTLFIELDVGPETLVTNNKTINWNDENGDSLEEEFLEKLDKEIKGDSRKFQALLNDKINIDDERYQEHLPLKLMGRSFRRQKKTNISDAINKRNAEKAVTETSKDLKKLQSKAKEILEKKSKDESKLDSSAKVIKEEVFDLAYGDINWEMTVRVEDEPREEWFTFVEDTKAKKAGVSISLNHPFTKKYLDREGKSLSLMMKLAGGLALAQILATKTEDSAANMSQIFNYFLKEIG